MEKLTTIGVDIAKGVFQVHWATESGRLLFRKRLSRKDFLPLMANLNPSLVGIEACSGAHYWGRELSKLGHEVKLMPPQYVKPYVKRNKNDAADAEACTEAVTRPTMRFVPVKTETQQELLMVHRVRDRLIGERTTLSNQIRGFFHEFGVVFPQGISKLVERAKAALVEDQEKVPALARGMLEKLIAEFATIGILFATI